MFRAVNLPFWRTLLLCLLLAFAALSLSRLAFLINSWESYTSVATTDLIWAFVNGSRFDMVALAYGLGPYLLLLMVAGGDVKVKGQALGRLLFLISVTAMLLLNFIDAEFYKFTDRRSTSDLFEFVFISNDVWHILPNIIRDFWHLLIEWLCIAGAVLWCYNRIQTGVERKIWHTKPLEWLARLAMIATTVLAMRGGTQRIPLMIQDASSDADPHLSLLILNTPFTIFKTVGRDKLPMPEYITQTEANAEWSPTSMLPRDSVFGTLKGHNVVVIIVESLGNDYLASQNGRGEGYAPFVDSLIGEGLFFANGFSNGHRSIEGIPAVLSSTPTLMFDPFITSPFSVNSYQSLANSLGKKGYSSAFYHGGNNGTMGFNTYCRQAGFQEYIGNDEYPNRAHYDGSWGIFDHHFLPFMAKDLNHLGQPFVAGLFTLSSHHPYNIPDEFADKVKHGPLPIHVSISYADMALKMFFAEAAKQPWFDSTLFVLTADHTSLASDPKFKTNIGSLRIPILFYHPAKKLHAANAAKVVQQSDIMPSVLHLVGYDEACFAFGESAFAPGPGMAVSFLSGAHQIIAGQEVLKFDGERAVSLYAYQTDSLLSNNLLVDGSKTSAQLEFRLKAVTRQYARALNLNRMTPEHWIRP